MSYSGTKFCLFSNFKSCDLCKYVLGCLSSNNFLWILQVICSYCSTWRTVVNFLETRHKWSACPWKWHPNCFNRMALRIALGKGPYTEPFLLQAQLHDCDSGWSRDADMQARRERRQHQRVANHATPSITISKAHFILVIHSQLIHENSDLIFLDRGNENSDLHGGFFPLQLPVACTIPWAASISTSKGVDGCT
jgi:hypothetical protein